MICSKLRVIYLENYSIIYVNEIKWVNKNNLLSLLNNKYTNIFFSFFKIHDYFISININIKFNLITN